MDESDKVNGSFLLQNFFLYLSANKRPWFYATAFVRMFLSVPAHTTLRVVMDYFVGKATFDSANSFKHLLTGLLIAVLFHGTFDFFIFLQANEAISE